MYTIVLDKQEEFIAGIQIEGASLSNSSCRLIIETTSGINFLCLGEITDDRCKIKIPKFKGLIPENSNGKIKLEVIAEDSITEPWSSNFITKLSKKVTVEVKNTEDIITKPKVTVEVKKNNNSFEQKLIEKIQEENITFENFKTKMPQINLIVKNLLKEFKPKNITEHNIAELIIKTLK